MSPPAPEFVLATANAHKAEEIAQILGSDVVLLPRPASVPEVEETGATLLDNARLKARALVRATGLAAIADDTGLMVDALGGDPGVRSARYAGEHADEDANVAKLLAALSGVKGPAGRAARFVTVAVAEWPGGRELAAEGVVNGWIAEEPRGDGGFGYDPVFVPGDPGVEGGETFAEMEPEAKNALSHRGRAFADLREALAAMPDA